MTFTPPIDPFSENIEDLSFIRSSDVGVGVQIEEGQLSIDVAQTAEEVVVLATMAGTEPGNISLHVHGDLLTVRGQRCPPTPTDAKYFYQECYWGKFSRTIVLPVEVQGELARAEYKYGVLVIHLPKVHKANEIPIEVMDE